jgi:predicted glycoside hydrolase/deacetylase ChbG (UPF0249 family)
MKSIILCADDYGQNESISQAIIDLIEKKRLSATSCLTTSPDWPAHAQSLLPCQNMVDIGLHFNLTDGQPLSSQWQAAHGALMPLAKLISAAYLRRLTLSAIIAELHAQLDSFANVMGQLPDFIDGHKHIHQLPIIREALFSVYEQRLRPKAPYLRCVNNPSVLFEWAQSAYFKKLIIQAVGARSFKQDVITKKIPHNTCFGGIYNFANANQYAVIFSEFLAKMVSGGIIMCHPGMDAMDNQILNLARDAEYTYLQSELFNAACAAEDIQLARFSAISHLSV